MIQDRLKALRSEMAKRGISLYVVPTADFHESEYVGEHFKARKYITGFTGSAGTAVITMDEAGLWTDGRYFVQAAAQLKDTTVKLFKIGEEGVPTVDEYIKDTLSDGGVIGFDGRVVNAAWGKRLSEIAKEKHGSMYVNEDLIDIIWTDRPPMSKAPVMIFDNKYTGEDISSKLKRVREQMAQKGCNTSSDVITLRYRLAFKCQGRRHKLCACSAFIPGTVTGQLHMVFAGRGCDRDS